MTHYKTAEFYWFQLP